MTDLDEIIANLHALNAKDVETTVAKRSVGPLHASVEATLNAGTSPEGAAWAPTVKGGKRAYARAASKLATKAIGTLIRMTVTGPEAYGHFGARGMVPRTMVPDAGAGVPPAVAKILRDTALEVFNGAIK